MSDPHDDDTTHRHQAREHDSAGFFIGGPKLKRPSWVHLAPAGPATPSCESGHSVRERQAAMQRQKRERAEMRRARPAPVSPHLSLLNATFGRSVTTRFGSLSRNRLGLRSA